MALLPQWIFGYQVDAYELLQNSENFSSTITNRSFYTGPQFSLLWQVSKRWIIKPSFSIGTAFFNNAFITLTGYGFKLPAALYVDSGLSADFALTRKVHLIAGVDYRFINFKGSHIQSLAGFIPTQLPSKPFHSVTANIGIAYSFAS